MLAFMERWKPGSTQGFVPATADQIAALAKPHGGLNALPRVYREFLETMGASTGSLRLTFGTTSISALLEDREDTQRERPDPRRYLKIAIGEDLPEDRYPDEFLELAHPTSDRWDAAICRIHEDALVRGENTPKRPFQTFSDWLRAIAVSRVAFEADPQNQTQSYGLGEKPEAVARAYEFFARLGFSFTELGASPSVIPLEHRDCGAIVLLSAPSSWLPSTGVELRARDKTQQRILEEVISDHKAELSGG
ncbi:SMI1/KNR4 family protein [Archangium violaceum]|uniref:SMI1/KNR4 family protein n=1 Tax=Archangium violaceum TaxID=83451 RepID=UPI001EF15F4C|nr:SMI1/KNR4 family protein [Archangium violaceum]